MKELIMMMISKDYVTQDYNPGHNILAIFNNLAYI